MEQFYNLFGKKVSTKFAPLETFSIRFFMGNRKPQFAVTRCSFTLPRFQILARRSVQFSSVHFYLAKIQYNTRIHKGIVRLQGSPEETRRLMKPGLPNHKEILSKKNEIRPVIR